MRHCFNLSIIPVFGLSEAYYLIHFIGLRVYCTGTNSAYFRASHPICGEAGDLLVVIELFIIAPLILLIWFLTIHRQNNWAVGLRFLGILHLVFLRFAIAFGVIVAAL